MFRRLTAAAWLLPLTAFAISAPAVSPVQAAEAQPGWTRYNATEAKMTFLVPVTPERSEQPVPEGPGAPGKMVFFKMVSGKQIFLSGYTDYAPSFNFDVDAELKANQDNFVQGINAQLLTSNPVMLGKSKGLEFTAQKAGELFAKGRFYIVKKRIYMVLAVVPEAEAQTTNVPKFLNSLTVKY